MPRFVRCRLSSRVGYDLMLVGARSPAHLIAAAVDDLKTKRATGARLDRVEAISVRPWHVLADEVIDVVWHSAGIVSAGGSSQTAAVRRRSGA
jgi:hypothetical protein